MTFLDEFNAEKGGGDQGQQGGGGGRTLGPRPRFATGDVWVHGDRIAAVNGVRLSILISAAFAIGSIVVFTGNVVVALLALISLVAIVVTVLAVFTLAGWTLGIIEAVSITILVGLSCDFSLHLAEVASTFSRGNRGKDAVARVGSPIFAAGTAFAVIPPGLYHTGAREFGAIIPACIILSLFYSLHLFTRC